MALFLVIIIVVGLLIAILLPKFLASSEIDSCLDVGGSFNYESCECGYSADHQYKNESYCETPNKLQR